MNKYFHFRHHKLEARLFSKSAKVGGLQLCSAAAETSTLAPALPLMMLAMSLKVIEVAPSPRHLPLGAITRVGKVHCVKLRVVELRAVKPQVFREAGNFSERNVLRQCQGPKGRDSRPC